MYSNNSNNKHNHFFVKLGIQDILLPFKGVDIGVLCVEMLNILGIPM